MLLLTKNIETELFFRFGNGLILKWLVFLHFVKEFTGTVKNPKKGGWGPMVMTEPKAEQELAMGVEATPVEPTADDKLMAERVMDGVSLEDIKVRGSMVPVPSEAML